MDLSEVPFNVPVVLQSIYMQKNLQNPLGSKEARCLTDNRDIYETLILHHVRDDKVAIESARNGRYLQVRASGECVFDPKQPGEWELFTMETDVNCALYFVSCHTGDTLHCSGQNVVKCPNVHRGCHETWRVVEPRTTTAVASTAQVQRGSGHGNVLAGKDGLNLVLELVRWGKTPKEIEEVVGIVMKMFDAPDGSASNSAMAVSVSKE